MASLIGQARERFLDSLAADTMMVDANDIPTNADKDNDLSKKVAAELLNRVPHGRCDKRPSGQTLGTRLEQHCAQFLKDTFLRLTTLRPGRWVIESKKKKTKTSRFAQFEHLQAIEEVLKEHPELRASLGSQYIIAPDVVIARYPEPDFMINRIEEVVDDSVSRRTPIRELNNGKPIFHASVSCKWTIRSDRSQNSRSEALNLIRNRKGSLPHIVVVTAEPLPSRLASISFGTGDMDCVYHVALMELQDAIDAVDHNDARSLLTDMVEGKRLRDISDLPLDLAI